MHKAVMAVVLFLSVTYTSVIMSCAMLETKVGVRTYTATQQQMEQVSTVLNIPKCDIGKTMVAAGIENTGGTWIVTVRCQ